MNTRALIRRKLCGCAVLVATLGLLIGGTSCSPPPRPQSQPAQGAAPGGQMKTLAVVAVNSYEKLMGDNGLGPNHKKRPWGVIVQTDGMNFSPLGALPIAKFDDLVAVAQSKGVQFNDRGNGIREVALPNNVTVFVKEQGGWALVGDTPEAFAQVPATLQADLTALIADYDAAASVYVKQVPEMYKQLATMAMRGGMEQSMRRLPDENDQQFELRRQMAEAQITELTKFLEETDKLTLGMAVDPRGQKAYFDMAIEAVPGTELAKQMAIAKEPRTDFGGFYQADAAATMTFANEVDPAAMPDLVAQLRANMASVRQQLNAAIEGDESLPAGVREAIKSAANDFAEALIASAETGKMDGGVSLRLGPDAMTLVAGTKMKQTEKVVAGLKKIEAAGKQSVPGFAGVTWDAAQIGDVKCHTLNIPLPPEADANFRRMVGDQLPIALGVAPEAIYLAIGRDNLDTLKRAIDASRADSNKKVPPFEFALSLGPILELVAMHTDDENLRPALQNVAAMLKNDAQGRDHIRVLAQVIDNGARYRFEAEEGALRALVQAALIVQMQQMGR